MPLLESPAQGGEPSVLALKDSRRTEAIRERFDQLAGTRAAWQAKAGYYYKDQRRYLQCLVPEGLKVLEIGCGPGAAAREVARRIGGGHVLAIDRSVRAIEQARAASAAEIAAGRMSLRQAAAEELELEPGEAPYDIAFAVRVGALDGRHPEREAEARRRIAAALTADGRLFIDGGDPLREIRLVAR